MASQTHSQSRRSRKQKAETYQSGGGEVSAEQRLAEASRRSLQVESRLQISCILRRIEHVQQRAYQVRIVGVEPLDRIRSA